MFDPNSPLILHKSPQSPKPQIYPTLTDRADRDERSDTKSRVEINRQACPATYWVPIMKRILHVLLLWNVCPALGFWSSSFRSPRARNKAPQIRSIIFPFAANPNERKRIRQSSFLLQRWKFHSFIALQDSEQPPENGSVDHSISSSLSQSTLVKKSSRICSIRSKNLGGSVASSSSQTNNQEDSFLSLNLQDGRLIAVTGETGAGKSILISKVIDLCSGGKASASLLSEEHPTATVEMDLELREPQLSMVKSIMRSFGLDPTTILNEQETNVATLHVQRTLSKSKSATRVTSKCQLQSTSVTLKQLQAIMSPLLAIVDAPAAASALQQPLSRLSMLDTVSRFEVSCLSTTCASCLTCSSPPHLSCCCSLLYLDSFSVSSI
jgi:hypothetical protein